MKEEIKSTLKSMDTEEFIDLVFYRPIGYLWAKLFEKLNVTPNAVSVASIFLGVAAGILFYFDDLRYTIPGILLLIWANSFDSADGQLARMTGQYSRLGRVLDGVCGDIWFITIYAAICLRLTPEYGIWIWVLGAAAGYFHSMQASMADYYRNFHLYFLKGKKGSELEDSSVLVARNNEITWKSEPVEKSFMFFYVPYTQNQEKRTTKMQQFRSTLRNVYGDQEIPQWLRDMFRAKSKPLMKYTNILSFNTRVIVLFISLLINIPWLYFVFELTVLNILLVYMCTTHEKICTETESIVLQKENNV